MEQPFEQVRSILELSRNITVLTGAGISAESGVPTYRDKDGLWNSYRAEDFSSVTAWAKSPATVWDWYQGRRAVMAAAEPNVAHKTLADLEARTRGQVVVLTQNVDGLHQRAGSKIVVELHGNVWNIRCTNCGEERCEPDLGMGIPGCYSCHGMCRPAVTWFGESLNRTAWEHAVRATHCDTFVVIGTSALVDPVAQLAPMAQKNHARIIEINTERTPISDIADFTLLGKAGEILPQLIPTEAQKEEFWIHELDLGRAFERGLERFYSKYPDLRNKLSKSSTQEQ